MAWRPYENLIEGELDNTVPGKVTGWMKFVGMKRKVKFNLKGDFHRDIKGKKILLKNLNSSNRNVNLDKENYMEGFSWSQSGEVGDITAGLEPVDYVDYPYIEWYSKINGRCVLELNLEQIEVV